jgi:DNA processing protein
VRLVFEATDPVLAAAAWSRLAEPGDEAAGTLLGHLGAVAALQWVVGGADGAPAPPADEASWSRARERWLPRLRGLDPQRELDALDRLGGRLVLPGTAEWPAGLDDLGTRRPPCLWVRGGPLRPALDRSVSLVGARACSAYGLHVAAELAGGLAERGITVVSGGAYGIDAAAHRGALAARGLTVAVLAGGIDRLYPAGNTDLLEAVSGTGAVVAESPPGSAPMRVRFLLRNRLIAALTLGTVVVEAAWRSGALSTANHAAGLLRPVGAVPGPVTSMVSAGCHRLLREGGAVCVTDAAEVAELVGGIGVDLAPAPIDVDARPSTGGPPPGLDPREAAVLEAVPLRGRAGAESIARVAGRSLADVRVALAYLELGGFVEREGERWRRARG